MVTVASLPFAGLEGISPGLLPSLVVTLVLGAVVFSLLGAFVSVAVREVFDAMTLANYFRFPMLFLSGVFAPLVAMPALLGAVAYLLPLTYVVDALRHGLAGPTALPLALDWALTMAFSVGLYLGAWRILLRQLEEPL